MLPSPPAEYRVSGVTSRGIFLFSPESKGFFLSFEPYRGPLTINLSDGPLAANPGDIVRLADGRLDFPDGSALLLSSARTWQPPPPPAARIDPPARAELLRAVALEILARAPLAGLAPLLGPLFNLPFPPLAAELRAAADCLAALRSGADPVSALSKILGLGRGLTPSGDDFIAGYLLAEARSRSALPGKDSLIPAAYAKTTTLSASLIECAALGSADERLLQACDALITGALPPTEIYALLSAYGSSSGLDAFAGMVTLLL
jgi:hypothetical protein